VRLSGDGSNLLPSPLVWMCLDTNHEESDMAHPVTRSIARATLVSLALAALVLPLSTMPVLGVTAGGCAGPTSETPDTVAPTQPGSLRVVTRAKGGSITLGWVASYDAVGVAGYSMYRDGVWKGTLCQAGVDLLGTVWHDRLGGKTKSPVTYMLYAVDAAGNVSPPATLVVAP
jgi:hypothetical protein